MSGIEISSYFKPKNGQEFYVLEDSYLKGGLRSVNTYLDINLIPTESRKVGALIYVIEEDKYYKFYPDVSTISPHTNGLVSINTSNSPYSFDFRYSIISAKTTTNNISIFLPELTSLDLGKSLTIKMDLNSNSLYTVEIEPFAGTTIDSGGTQTLAITGGLNAITITVISTTDWAILNSYSI